MRLEGELSRKERIIRVSWDANLQISKGDEIEITRGIVNSENDIRASQMKNITSGRNERREIEGGYFKTRKPKDIKPSIRGIVKEIHASRSGTVFKLVEGVGMLEVGLTKLLRKVNSFLDKEIIEKCINKKEAEDIVTSAFRILEERIRAKIGASYERSGTDLINDALNPKTGKLTFGKTTAEQEGLFQLYRGSILFLRNPPSHRFVEDYSEFEVFEIVILVNLLLNILNKCQFRSQN